MANKPNLFLVGAPKSGTTALSSYLRDHPDVWVAPDEMVYFGGDLVVLRQSGQRRRLRDEAYFGTFAPHDLERYRGDHSVYYLYSTVAAAEIFAFDPDSRVIAMLRNPVDQMHSQHSEMLYQGEEDIRDFAAALAAEEDRRRGQRLPAGCRKAFSLFYRDLASYADQVDRYLSLFGPERVHVIIYDDFAADTAGVYRGVLEFLDVDPGHEPTFAVVNSNKAVRSTFAQGQLRAGSPTLRRLARLVVRDHRARASLRRRVATLNTVRRPRPPVDPALRRRLEEEFAPEVRRLEDLLGRDLSMWSTAATR